LRNIGQRGRWLYLDEIQEKLLNCTGVLVHPSTIYRSLTRDLQLTLKLAYAKAAQRNEIRRAQHQGDMDAITGNPRQFIFIDETAKDRNAARSRRYWQRVGSKTDVLEVFFDRSRWLYTLIAAVDIDGFIPEACDLVYRRRNTQDNDPEAGTVDGARFEQYVEHVLVPVLGSYYAGEPRSIVVMDNASTHISQRVFDLIAATGAQLIFLPEYSPDYNPIEFCFRQYKAHLKRNTARYGGNYLTAHLAALGAPTHDNMCRYYRHAGIIRGVPDPDAKAADTRAQQAFLLVIVAAGAYASQLLTRN
jgi:transposase